MRLHRPAAVWLLLWPCWWSVGLATDGDVTGEARLFFLFFAGAVVMRSAGCVVNDLWDRDVDARVRRTANRPLASGELSVGRALALLCGLLVVGAGILFALAPQTVPWGLGFALAAGVYPLAKRIVGVPQIVLGMTFGGAGALMGWVAATGGPPSPAALLLYVGCALWTAGYDTTYAFQDADDDKRLGLGSATTTFGGSARRWIMACYALAVLAWIAVGVSLERSWVYHVGIAIAAVHMYRQIAFLDPGDARACMNAFRSNVVTGGIVFAGIVADGAYR